MNRYVLIIALLLLSGCSYNWHESQKVDEAVVRNVESPSAGEFCSKLMGGMKRACAVRAQNTETKIWYCVRVFQPGDTEAAVHELAHCFYDHD